MVLRELWYHSLHFPYSWTVHQDVQTVVQTCPSEQIPDEKTCISDNLKTSEKILISKFICAVHRLQNSNSHMY